VFEARRERTVGGERREKGSTKVSKKGTELLAVQAPGRNREENDAKEHDIEEKTYSMKVHYNPTIHISLEQLRSHRSLQTIYYLTRSDSLNKLILILKVHIKRQHMPTEQPLAI
jgi:hypothetical protein